MRCMAKKRAKTGRPPQEKTRGEYLEVRLDADEKQAFKDAAELAGVGVSTWVRERLLTIARKELEAA